MAACSAVSPLSIRPAGSSDGMLQWNGQECRDIEQLANDEFADGRAILLYNHGRDREGSGLGPNESQDGDCCKTYAFRSYQCAIGCEVTNRLRPPIPWSFSLRPPILSEKRYRDQLLDFKATYAWNSTPPCLRCLSTWFSSDSPTCYCYRHVGDCQS